MDNTNYQNPPAYQQETDNDQDPQPPISPGKYDDALQSIHATGTWTIVLGALNVILSPLLESVIYNKASSGRASEATLIIISLVTGLIVGGVFIGLGVKLKRAKPETIRQADRTLRGLAVVVLIVTILSLIDGGRGVGLIDLLVLIALIQARGKINKLGPGIKSQPLPKTHIVQWILAIVGGVVVLLIAAIVSLHALFKIYAVSGPAMAPAYNSGQEVLASKSYRTPKLGDVIVFREPTNSKPILIKRIVAIGGDKVVIQNGTLTVYDRSSPQGFNPDSSYEPANEVTAGNLNLVVPRGEVFVLGDNRSDSLDSRVFGPVPAQDIIGRVIAKVK